VSKPSDLFPVETSYVYRPEENIFAPLISAQNLMPLYNFIPLSVHYNFSANVSITQTKAKNMITKSY
jgi:hypothetical protein